MAKKPAGKPTDNADAPAKSGSMLMTILQVAGFGVAAISLVVLVAAMHDLGFVDLTHTLHAMIVPMVVLIILSMSLYAFASGQNAAAKLAAKDAALEQLKLDVEQKVAAAEARLETYLGPAHAALIEENETLKAAIEDVRRQEEEKIGAELEELRSKNVELQEKINMWAVGKVEAAMTDEQQTAA